MSGRGDADPEQVGRSNPEIRDVVTRVDAAREHHLAESMRLVGLPVHRAELRARLTMAVPRWRHSQWIGV